MSKETSKYDAEFDCLSEYALLGRVRAIISGYRFTAGRYGRRAAQKAGALEEMLYQEQEARIDEPEAAPMQRDANGTAPRIDFRHDRVSAEGGSGFSRPTQSIAQKSGTGRYVQLEMVLL